MHSDYYLYTINVDSEPNLSRDIQMFKTCSYLLQSLLKTWGLRTAMLKTCWNDYHHQLFFQRVSTLIEHHFDSQTACRNTIVSYVYSGMDAKRKAAEALFNQVCSSTTTPTI
jgi:hypothetical protein